MRGGEQARLLGKWGEMQVANYLRKQGYNLVATNRKYLAFVEVKLRRNDDIMTARESVTLSKQRKLRAAALLYLQAHPTQLQPRFDVAEIYAPQGTATRHPHINYLENAF